MKENRPSSRPFKAKGFGTCPLGPEGKHPVMVGDIIVRTERTFRWNEERVSQYNKIYLHTCAADYVHAECLERHNENILEEEKAKCP